MTATEIRNNKLKKKISTIFFTNKQRYGATKIHQVLLKEGISVSLKHVQKLMKQLNLRSIVVKKYGSILFDVGELHQHLFCIKKI
ncbi:IS3 family transposase [Enterococcus faecium]|uniref:IS3 family transposase n=1 Tax=Enterococcus faecium TaxID=1352 RepID=UPI001558E698|nr:IS3 family transposase [Enterococcus faecium]